VWMEVGRSARRQQRRHVGFVHPDADAVAGHARLRDLEPRAADLVPVPDAHEVVGQAFDREVLTKLSVHEVGSLQLLLPEAIRLDLVDEDGTLLTPVPGHVTLTVAVEIQLADTTAAPHGALPDRGVHRPPLPLDVAWKSDVHREDSSHCRRSCYVE